MPKVSGFSSKEVNLIRNFLDDIIGIKKERKKERKIYFNYSDKSYLNLKFGTNVFKQIFSHLKGSIR